MPGWEKMLRVYRTPALSQLASAQLALLSTETVAGLPPLELGSFNLDEMTLNLQKRLQGRSRAKYSPARDGFTSSPSRCGQPMEQRYHFNVKSPRNTASTCLCLWLELTGSCDLFLFLDIEWKARVLFGYFALHLCYSRWYPYPPGELSQPKLS